MAPQPCRRSAFQLRSLSQFLAIILGAAPFLLSACGGGGSGGGSTGGGGNTQSTVTSVSVSCAATSVQVTGTNQCTASVQGTNNPSQTVSWSVNSTTGGNSIIGTVSSSGLYTAPAAIPTGTSTVSISAVSTEDTTKSGSAQVSLAYPVPVLSLVTPSSVAAGATDTTITVTGSEFAPTSTVGFGSLTLQTTYDSANQLTAVIPAAQLASAGNAVVTVNTSTPGGGTSAGAQFTITPVVVAAKLVLLATPVYSGSPNGPWQLSVAAADSSGNPVPNLPVAIKSSEGTITQNSTTTDSNGTLTASITPPASYGGDVVEVSALSGSQTAVVELVFAASTTSVSQQAAVVINRKLAQKNADTLSAADSSTSTSSSSGVNQLIMGSSNGTASNNLFAGTLNPCLSNSELDTTQSVDCQDNFSTNQVQVTPFTPAATACSVIGTVQGTLSCGGAVGVLVACASPETGAGALICAGGMGIEEDLSTECASFIASGIAQLLAKNDALKAAAGETEINIAGLVQGASPTDIDSLLCNAIDAANAGSVINVTYTNVTHTPTSQSISLGDQVDFTATNASVTWSIENNLTDNSLGTIDSNTGVYTAPTVAPTQNYCAFYSTYYNDACPVTIVATSATDSTKRTLTTLLLSIGSNDAPPLIQSLSPNPVAAGSSALQLSINGTGFLPGDTVTFNGAQRTPVFIGPNQFQISLSASDLATASSYPVTVSRDYLAIASSNGSSTQNLTVNTSPTAVPSAPAPASPGTSTDTGYLVSTTNPTLQWTGTNATQYALAISQYPYGTSNVVFNSGTLNGGQTSLAVPAGYLSNGTKYRWNMQAYNSAGWSAVSSSLYFTVSTGALPGTPNDISPGESASPGPDISTTTPTLQWSGSGATTFELAISHSPYGASNVVYDDAAIPSSTTSLAIPSGILQNGVSYAWNVQATDSAGQSSWSTQFFFTVNSGSSSLPQIPSLVSPGTSSDTGFTINSTTPTMQWSGSGATTYELAISQYPYGSVNVIYDNSAISGSSTTLAIPSGYLQSGIKYAWNMQATNANGQSSWSAPLYFSEGGAATPSLNNLSASPSSPVAGQQFILTVNGSNFDPSSVQILITGTGCAPCTVPNAVLTAKTASQVVGPVTLNSPGSYTVTVQNGSSGTQSNGLSLSVGGVTPALGSLTASPNPPVAGQQFTLTLNGSNFDPSSVQILINGGACGPCTIANGTLTTKTTTQVVAPVTLSAAASYNITVQDGSGGGQSNALTLVVGTPTPSLNSLVTTPSSPASGQQFTIDISGNNFDPSTVQVLFTGPGCAPCTLPNANLTTKNATLLIGPATLSTTGSYTVTVQNGSSGTQSNGLPLTIGSVTPSLNSLSTNPSSPVAGQQFTLTLNGSNFTPSSVQLLIYGGTCGPCTIANGTLTTQTATQIVTPVTLSTAASYNIYAQNGAGGGQSNSLTLVIGTPTPSITALVTSPSSPAAGQQFTIDISGNNFDPSTVEVLFTGPGCAPCTIANANLTTKNATLLIGPVTLSTAGSYTVTVQNGSSGTPSNGEPLTIGSASTAPTATTGSASSITSTTATLGGTVNPNGLDTHFWFLYGTNSSLSGASQTPSQDLGSGTSSSGISANISGLTSNTPYYFELQASNSAGTTSGAIVSFTTSVAVPPTPTGLSPGSTASPGPTVTTLTPTLTWNASTGATAYSAAVESTSGGIVYSANVTTNSAPIPSGKLSSGTTYIWTVSASNSAGSSSTAPIMYFTVTTPAPTITSVSPNPVPGSNSGQTLQIYGSNFQSGATLTYYDTNNTPYSGRSATFVNSGQLTDPAFDNANDAGTWKVQVVNPGGQTSNTYSFTVN